MYTCALCANSCVLCISYTSCTRRTRTVFQLVLHLHTACTGKAKTHLDWCDTADAVLPTAELMDTACQVAMEKHAEALTEAEQLLQSEEAA